MLAMAWPFGYPARFTDTGSEQTRSAQTLLAFSPVPIALLGHITRPRIPKERKGLNAKVSLFETNQQRFRPTGRAK